MPKMKTRKALRKKVRITATGKVMRRMTGQNHFNAKESGNVTRAKRRDIAVQPTVAKVMRRALNA